MLQRRSSYVSNRGSFPCLSRTLSGGASLSLADANFFAETFVSLPHFMPNSRSVGEIANSYSGAYAEFTK